MSDQAVGAWHPDPHNPGQLRWWDGQQWTEHVRPVDAQAASVQAIVAQVAAEKQKKAAAREQAKAAKAASAAAQIAMATQHISASGPQAGPILQVQSRVEGRNSTVTLYADRIERVKPKRLGGLMSAHQETEVIPIRVVTSVTTKKDGLVFTEVQVIASGNSIGFRLHHDEAARFKNEVMRLVLGHGTPTVPLPQSAPAAATPTLGDRLRELTELREAGLLTDDEFQAQKAKLLA